MLANEQHLAHRAQTRAALLHIWQVMQACVERGFRQTGLLPGVLKVRRRAPRLHRMLDRGRHAEARWWRWTG